MRVAYIGGNHPRHLYYANRIAQDFPLCGAVIELREAMHPQPPEGIAEIDRVNFVRHFTNRDLAERRHFGRQPLPDCPIHEARGPELSGTAAVEFISQCSPDVVLVMGGDLVREPLVSALPRASIDLKLGLSPRYQGMATLFWPFYFLEPNHAGVTFEAIGAEGEEARIIHQSLPQLEPEDGIHDVACRAVIAAAEEAVQLLRIFQKKGEWRAHRPSGQSKYFLSSDFRPEHLRVIYNLFDDDMVKHYLGGRLPVKAPQLIRQF